MAEPALVVLISDLLDPAGVGPALAAIGQGGQRGLIVHVVDRSEAEPTEAGAVAFSDAESADTLRATLTAEDLADYRRRFAAWLDEARRACNERNVGYFRVWTEESIPQVLTRIFGQ